MFTVHIIVKSSTKSLHSDTACINDNLDPSNANCDWYVHPDFPTLLLVVANRRIADDEQLYLSYGLDYWCQDRFPIHILKAAVKGYAIDIDKSATWRRLKCYKELRRALDTNDSEDIKATSKPRPAEQTDSDATQSKCTVNTRSQSPSEHASSDQDFSRSATALQFETGWHHKSTTKRSKNKTANDTLTRSPTMNTTKTTIKQKQTNNARHAIVTDNTNGLKRQRIQAADINTRPKKRKTDPTDPELTMNETLHHYFDTEPVASTSTKRGTHPTESTQRRKCKKIQIIDDGACEDPHVDSSVDSSILLCMEAHTVHSLRPTHTTHPTDRQCDLPAHDKRIADS